MEKKKLYRSRFNKKICGVCGGIAEYFGIDPTVVRVIWVILAFLPVLPMIIIYIILALVIPENPNDTIVMD
ncbi:MAG TPA: PspC domain-containing protein [Candidatus Faeciplasma gallinarum]|uniref:PspC domain-containing protein n=1 Tax=Candidatus Faeciplasma gallinarum TaxID=2840799 RepID=A0A9D1EPA2_9FIRM|nr:PspC domain-containing protein [Candidatus Faeciplasma gallinarum]